MYKISEETLQLRGALDTTYIKGKGIFNRGEIKNIRSTEDFQFFQGKVQGTRLYEVEAEFAENGDIQRTRCTCPAYHSYYGDCKHITALLLFIDHYRDPRDNQENRIKTLIEEYQQSVKPPKTMLNLDLNLSISEGKGKIEMALGENKSYIVKDIRAFLRDYQEGSVISFGKNFNYDPESHQLDSYDENIINYLSLLLDMRELTAPSFSRHKDEVFQGRTVVIENRVLEGLLQRMEHPDKGITLWIEGNYYENVRFDTGEIPISLRLTEESRSRDLRLEPTGEWPIVPLDQKGNLIFYRGKIYRMNSLSNQWVRPLMNIFLEEKSKGLEIPGAQGERFITEVLPTLQYHTNCEIEEKIEKKIIREPLKTKLFLDQEKGKMVAKLLFIYGKVEINPFSPKERKKKKKSSRSFTKVLMREQEKENHLLDLFGEGDFNVEKERCYLEEDDKIFRFLETLLPKLQKEEHLSIYYSDEFKKVKVLKENEINGVISLNHGLDLLECSLDIESIPKEELMEVLQKIREKAKYHRLSDGTFLSFTKENTGKLASWLSEMEIGYQDFEDGKLQIPKYKAFEVHGLQDENPLFQEAEDFKDLVADFEKVFEENQKSDFQKSPLTLPREMNANLRQYQNRGFQWLATLSAYGFGGILADEMGLGKTIQALTYLAKEKEKGAEMPSILVVPTSLVYNWEDEIRRFTPNLKTLIISGSKEEREEKIRSIGEYDVIITSYPLLRRDKDFYEPYRFHACILDEAQYIKNKSSQSAKAVKTLKGKHRFALTGTPLENNLTELWSIFDFLIPGYLGSYKSFVEKYQKPISVSGDQLALRKLKRKIEPFILRRLKTDVLKELPEKMEGKILVDMTKEQQKIYSVYLQKIKGEIKDTVREKGIDRSQIQILAGLTRLRQISCHPGVFIEGYEGGSGKLQALAEIIDQGLGEEHRFLIFSQFTGVLKMVRKDLEEKGYKPLYLDGSTPMNQRGDLVKTFNGGEVPIFLISLKAGGTGLNLTSADVVIHLDPWWNPAVESQATDRAHRIGQKKMVQVKKLIARGTIEEKIHQIQEQKKEIVDQIVQKGETMLTKLSKEELLDLLEG